MRCPRSQQTHSHDMILFGSTLAQVGQLRISGAKIATDPGNEYHKESCNQRETNKHTFDVEIG